MKPSIQEKITLFIFHNEENFVLAVDLIGVIILLSLVVLMVWFGYFLMQGRNFYVSSFYLYCLGLRPFLLSFFSEYSG